MAKTRKVTGGLYFKDLRGEAVAGQCWKRSARPCLEWTRTTHSTWRPSAP
jgi:hypothetical protein